MDKIPNALLRELKGKAQLLEPMLKVGKQGLSPGFVKTVDQALTDHALVKIKFSEFKEEKKELARQLVGQTTSHLIMQVGHVIVLYRQKPEPAAEG